MTIASLYNPPLKTFFTGVLLLLLYGSCKKFVEIPPPINPIVSAVVFTNDAAATGTVTGIYSEMMNPIYSSSQFSSAGVTLYAGMCADELLYYFPSPRDEFIKNQLTEISHGSLSSLFWDRAYKYIYTANLIIESLDKSSQLSPSVKTRLIGECKFIRAFCFFYLVNFFGDVPLTTSSDFRTNAELPREKIAIVYQKIIADLREAKALLPADYSTAPARVRPNKWAAAALLARVFLYRHNWTGAETEAGAVIDANLYQLEKDPSHVFLAPTREAIWQLLPVVPLVSTWEGNLIIPAQANSIPSYLLTNGLYTAFEAGDLRKASWVAPHTFAGITQYYPFKYKARTDSARTEYYIVLRLAEQYLIRAEARAQQNKLSESRDDLDSIRQRAGLPATTAATKEELLMAIEQERRVELFAEWGHRWFDLKRTNRANTVLGLLKQQTWQSTDTLWPIPNSQINANSALRQNPGY